MNRYNFKICTQEQNQHEICELLYLLKDELFLPDRASAQRIIDLCFTHGGMMGSYHNNVLCGTIGYFFGEPDCDYANKEVAFLYVAGARNEYRRTRLFRKGLIFTLQELQKIGLQDIRLQAEAENPYTNKLYARFAQPLNKTKNLRGFEVITYGGSIQNALNYLQYLKRPSFTPRKDSVPSLRSVALAVG